MFHVFVHLRLYTGDYLSKKQKNNHGSHQQNTLASQTLQLVFLWVCGVRHAHYCDLHGHTRIECITDRHNLRRHAICELHQPAYYRLVKCSRSKFALQYDFFELTRIKSHISQTKKDINILKKNLL